MINLEVIRALLTGTRAPWRNGWSRVSPGKAQDKPKTLLYPKIKKCSKNDEDMSKGHKSPLNGAPKDQMQGNLSIKIKNDYNVF